MEFIEGYYPLSLIKSLINKEINPFKANRMIVNNPKRQFIPNYSKFIKEFQKFLFNYINREKEHVFEELKNDIMNKADQIIILLNLSNKLEGMNLPYSEIIKEIINKDLKISQFKEVIIQEIHHYIQKILQNPEIGETKVFNLKQMKNTPFIKYSDKILELRKQEFLKSPVHQSGNFYDISKIKKTYYGSKILRILKLDDESFLPLKDFKKFEELAKKLNLSIRLIKK